jgi:hypothetical protein
MKHAWLILFAIGCGTSGGGEPQHGTATLQYGSSNEPLTVGAAIADKQDATMMYIELGSDHVTCSTDLINGTTSPGAGRYADVDLPATPGTYPQANVGVMNISANSINLDEASGSVTITSIDTRVMGSITFTTTDMTVGTIAVSGTFDVKKCF